MEHRLVHENRVSSDCSIGRLLQLRRTDKGTVTTMTKREQMIECMRAMEEGMFVTGTADHVSQIDIPRLLWWICKTLFLLLEKAIKK